MSDAPSQTPPEGTPPPSQPAPAQAEPHLTQEYRQHVDALLQGKEMPVDGTEDLVDDLRACAQKQSEARQALQQATQFGQAKQSEVMSLEGEAGALMRVLKRTEDRAAQKT